MATKCPGCNKSVNNVFRCDNCGDLRCAGSCTGTMGSGMKYSAAPGHTCKACRKGKYKKV